MQRRSDQLSLWHRSMTILQPETAQIWRHRHFQRCCPRRHRGSKAGETKAFDSILTFDDFSLDEKSSKEPTTTSTKTTMTNKETVVPETPAQLVNLQSTAEQKELAENDVAEIIATTKTIIIYTTAPRRYIPTTRTRVSGACKTKCTSKDASLML